MLFGFETLLAAGIPAGVLAEPTEFLTTGPDARLHLSFYCGRLSRESQRKLAPVHVVVTTTPPAKFCSGCVEHGLHRHARHPVPRYVLEARTAHYWQRRIAAGARKVAAGDCGWADVVELRQAVQWATDDTRHAFPVLRGVVETLREKAETLARQALDLVAPAGAADTATRRCAAALIAGFGAHHPVRANPPGDGEEWPALLGADDSDVEHVVTAAWRAWLTSSLDGSTPQAAADAAVQAGRDAAGDEPTTLEQVPALPRHLPESFPSPQAWAAAEWRDARDEALAWLAENWQHDVETLVATSAAQPGRLVAIPWGTPLEPTRLTRDAYEVLAAFDVRVHTAGRTALAVVPTVVADWAVRFALKPGPPLQGPEPGVRDLGEVSGHDAARIVETTVRLWEPGTDRPLADLAAAADAARALH